MAKNVKNVSTEKDDEEIQKRLDVKKWLDSEQANKDKCGTYIYCQFCNKDKKYPCAYALKKFNEKKK